MNYSRIILILFAVFCFSCSRDHEKKMKIAEDLGNSGKYEEAIKILDEIIEKDPEFMRAYTYKASYLSVMPGGHDKAMQVLDEALKIDPACGGCYYSIGLFSEGQESITALDKAIELNNKDFEAYYARAMSKRLNGDFRGAIKDFNKAVELNPDIEVPRSVLVKKADCWIELNVFDSAWADINEALRYNNQDCNAYCSRALYYLKAKQDIKKAREDFNRSKELGLDTATVRIGEELFRNVETKQN